MIILLQRATCRGGSCLTSWASCYGIKVNVKIKFPTSKNHWEGLESPVSDYLIPHNLETFC